MASLKEVKGRILTVSNTKKITSAMKMVSSAKLHKAQASVAGMIPYEEKLHQMLTNILNGDAAIGVNPFTVNRPVKKVALVVFSSNSSLCGSFNVNIIKYFQKVVSAYKALGVESIEIYTIGKKVDEALRKEGVTVAGSYTSLSEKPNYSECAALADKLIRAFEQKLIDKVEFVYNHFKSMGSQVLTRATMLPLQLDGETDEKNKEENQEGVQHSMNHETDYIIEPSATELLKELLPKVLRLKLYATLLDANTAEHAARMIAIQVATDNATDLMEELTLMYNKTRQQSITNELLDIMGGTIN